MPRGAADGVLDVGLLGVGFGVLAGLTPPDVAYILPETRSKLLIVNKIELQDIGNS